MNQVSRLYYTNIIVTLNLNITTWIFGTTKSISVTLLRFSVSRFPFLCRSFSQSVGSFTVDFLLSPERLKTLTYCSTFSCFSFLSVSCPTHVIEKLTKSLAKYGLTRSFYVFAESSLYLRTGPANRKIVESDTEGPSPRRQRQTPKPRESKVLVLEESRRHVCGRTTLSLSLSKEEYTVHLFDFGSSSLKVL